jgi:hypothetical protein
LFLLGHIASLDAVRGDEKMPSFFFKNRNRAAHNGTAHQGQGSKAATEYSYNGKSKLMRIYAPSARRPTRYSLGDPPNPEKIFIAGTTEPTFVPLQPSRKRNLQVVDRADGEGSQARGRVARVNDENCEWDRYIALYAPGLTRCPSARQRDPQSHTPIPQSNWYIWSTYNQGEDDGQAEECEWASARSITQSK